LYDPFILHLDRDVRRLVTGDARFKSVLDRAHVPATVRLTRGRDIAAACGQLAALT
jgi:adenine C2-methylase RlmN of 23S rRNA A2503 and tRNA A37